MRVSKRSSPLENPDCQRCPPEFLVWLPSSSSSSNVIQQRTREDSASVVVQWGCSPSSSSSSSSSSLFFSTATVNWTVNTLLRSFVPWCRMRSSSCPPSVSAFPSIFESAPPPPPSYAFVRVLHFSVSFHAKQQKNPKSMAFCPAISRAHFRVGRTNSFSSPVQSREILRQENRFLAFWKTSWFCANLQILPFVAFTFLQLGRSVFFLRFLP